jgi:hypothetical protein
MHFALQLPCRYQLVSLTYGPHCSFGPKTLAATASLGEAWWTVSAQLTATMGLASTSTATSTTRATYFSLESSVSVGTYGLNLSWTATLDSGYQPGNDLAHRYAGYFNCTALNDKALPSASKSEEP